ETHHAADDIAGLEAQSYARRFLRQQLSQTFLKLGDSNLRRRLELDLEHSFARTTGPKVNGVDRVSGVLHADVAERDIDVPWAHLARDRIERFDRKLLRRLQPRAAGRANPQRKLSGIDDREDLATEVSPDNEDDQRRDGE